VIVASPLDIHAELAPKLAPARRGGELRASRRYGLQAIVQKACERSELTGADEKLAYLEEPERT